MLFNSYIFIFLFLPVALAGFFAATKAGRRVAAGWLVLASLLFYAWWNPPYVLVLILSILVNFGFGRAITRRAGGTGGRGLLTVGVSFNLALLAYYKYANFFVDNVNAAAGSDWTVGAILLPIGISFYTFTQIAYLIDCARGQAQDYDLVNYALFVSFFPQLIAGPILHHKEMMPQFAEARTYRPSASNMAVGTTIFVIGLFKKAVLADGIAEYATPVFALADGGGQLDMLTAWGGALAYTFQLYFDFSGYSDMAIGLARMFGIILPLNFASPYKSRTIVEFWRTWHMTLSRFLRDYLYIPLGGNRKGSVRRYVNLFLTMLLGGFWHGAGWNFAIWGALHGIYLIINHGWSALAGPVAVGWRGRARSLAGWAVTFLAVIIGWVFFRAVTLEGALAMLQGMAGLNGLSLPSALIARLGSLGTAFQEMGVTVSLSGGSDFVLTWLWIAGLFVLSVAAPNTQEIMRRFEPALDFDAAAAAGRLRWRPNALWAAATAGMAAVSILSLTRVSEFLYFQF